MLDSLERDYRRQSRSIYTNGPEVLLLITLTLVDANVAVHMVKVYMICLTHESSLHVDFQ